MVEASTQTDYPGQSQIEDAFYFLEERPPAFSIFHADGGYTTPGGTRITGALRREFYALRGRYRDQQEATSQWTASLVVDGKRPMTPEWTPVQGRSLVMEEGLQLRITTGHKNRLLSESPKRERPRTPAKPRELRDKGSSRRGLPGGKPGKPDKDK